jgi:hypothetical protein
MFQNQLKIFIINVSYKYIENSGYKDLESDVDVDIIFT